MTGIMPQILTHLQITFIGVLIACAIAIPLGAIIAHVPALSKYVLGIVDVIQTVPTLSMMSILMLIFGLNNKTVITSIVLFSLFPITRNTFAGVTSVDSGIIRSAKGIGMSNGQIVRKIEIPLALPLIISGIRIAFVTALGIATTGVFVGAGGLGMIIWRGVQMRNPSMIFSGALPVSLLAILSDFFLTALQKKIEKR